MAMNKQRSTSNLFNILSYDDAGNIVLRDYSQTIRYNWNGTIHAFTGPLSVSSVAAAVTDTDRFLVSDGGVLKYRTGAEVLSDIGAIGGSGATGQVAYWNGTNSQTGSNNLFWDAANARLGIGTNVPTATLQVSGSAYVTGNFGFDGQIRDNRDNGIITQSISSVTVNRILTIGNGTYLNINFPNGNLLVGTTTDSGQRLQVQGTSFFSDIVGIGASPSTGNSLNVASNIVGTFGTGIFQQGQVQSNVTGASFGFLNTLNIVNTAFTTNSVAFAASQGTIGGSVTLSANTGFLAASSLATGTNVYGFRGQIASGTNRWNLYMDGTADNYLAGALSIGVVGGSRGLRIGLAPTAADSSSNFVNVVIPSSVTSAYRAFGSSIGLNASGFTLPNLSHFEAIQDGAFTAGVVTNHYGFRVNALISGTNVYAFHSNMPSATGRWNLYMAGTADNYLAGKLLINTTTVGTFNLDVNGTARVTGGTLNDLFIVRAGTTGQSIVNIDTSAFSGDRVPFSVKGHASQAYNFLQIGKSGNEDIFKIDSAGKVGINNTNPTGQLDVSGGLGTFRVLTSGAELYLTRNGNNDFFANGGTSAELSIGANNNLKFLTGSTLTERARITSGGNLLVGTTTDAGFRLDVNGTARVSGASTFGGTLNINTAAWLQFNGANVLLGEGTNTFLQANGGGSIIFRNNTPSELMRITAAGNVAMNTTTPVSDSVLTIKETSALPYAISLLNRNSTQIWKLAVDINSVDDKNLAFVDNTSAQARMILTSGGNLLVGTTTDNGSRFQVSGAATFSSSVTATSFIKSGGTSAQYLMADGSTSTLTNPVTGTGTTNFLPKWTSGSALGNSIVSESGSVITIAGNLNIGSLGSLSINAGTAATPLLTQTNNYTQLYRRSGGVGIYLGGTGDAVNFYDNVTHIFRSEGGGSERMRITSTGNLLVGTSVDQGYRVQITGSGDNMLNVWGATAPSIRLDNAASGATQRFVIGLATATNNFIQGANAGDVCMTPGTSSALVFGMWQTSSSSEVMRISTSSNVLIGKNTDSGQKLQVVGKVNLTSLPTSATGLMAGDVWNNGGVLNIV